MCELLGHSNKVPEPYAERWKVMNSKLTIAWVREFSRRLGLLVDHVKRNPIHQVVFTSCDGFLTAAIVRKKVGLLSDEEWRNLRPVVREASTLAHGSSTFYKYASRLSYYLDHISV